MKKERKIDENLYNERSLYLLNIRELRDLGRKIGVPAPATLKKQDLVDYILKIVYGEVDAPARNSYGRPSVREVDINQYLTKIMKKTDINDELIGASFDDIDSIFKVASPDDSSKTGEIAQRIFVEDDDGLFLREFAFVESKNDIAVSKSIKEKYNLENLDVVEAILSGKSFKIVSINGKLITNPKQLKNENLGKKQVFHFCTKDEIKDDILKQIEEAKTENLLVVVYSEDETHASGVEFVKVHKNISKQQAYKEFMALVNLCEKFVFEGENIMLITDESSFVEDVVESFDEDVSNRIKKHLQAKIDEFTELGNALLVYKQDAEVIYQ